MPNANNPVQTDEQYVEVRVKKLKILNYKCFRDFEIKFNECVNIIVGNNDEGKSTILEALQLALSGILNGRTLFTDVYESLFNRDTIEEYIINLKTGHKKTLPTILIEVYLNTEDLSYIVLALAGLPVFWDVAISNSINVLNTNDNSNTLLVNL